jgi:hypothetical protein
MGSGLHWVNSLTTMPNGDLVAGGAFTAMDGFPSNNIARWNGASWSPLGSGASSYVMALTSMPNGDLIAGGWFTTMGGIAASHVARWNGSAWSAMGTGLSGDVYGLAVLSNGDVVAGGTFYWTNGTSTVVTEAARWNGAAWSGLGTGVDGAVYAVCHLSHTRVALGGSFLFAGGAASARFGQYDFDLPIFDEQPSAAAACSSSPVAFDVSAIGHGVLSYQWQVEASPSVWANLAATPTPLPCGGRMAATQPNDPITQIITVRCPANNLFQIRCVVSNECGSSESSPASLTINSADFNGDGDTGTDADIEAFFACLGGNCCPTCGTADFNADGDPGTDADIDSFFRVLAGGSC